jgi:uncharacterized protein (TIGR04255 family)
MNTHSITQGSPEAADAFPIPTLDRLPMKIDPCPIVEAILEIRYVTSEAWRTLPGLLFAHIRDHYPEQKDLPLAQMPEQLRRNEPSFTYQPLVQFLGAQFLIQFGPRVVSLVTKPNNYPGWGPLEKEMNWLLLELQGIGFIAEGERLGIRYINFFQGDMFEQLLLDVNTAGRPLTKAELSVATVLRRQSLTARLQVANNVLLATDETVHRGSVLDVDVWLRSLDFDLFKNGIECFQDAHTFEKQIFFGLLKPEFLATLNPIYE